MPRHNDVAKVLLDYGGDWSIRDDWEMTVLHRTVDAGDSNVFMAYLLEKAYNGSSASQFDEFLNAKNVRGGTALIMAALKGRSLCVALLLKYGADWSLASEVEVTALHVSCWMGQETELALLLNVARNAERSRFESFLNHRNDQGKTALLDAIETDRPPFVKQLLEHGADYALAKLNGETALHVGSFRGFESAIERVLERTSLDTDQPRFTSFLNARNDKGKTALMDAAETDRSSIIQLLLKYGADYTVQDISGFTALHHSTSKDNRASVECLLEHAQKDADVQRFHDFLLRRDKEGRTAWMNACERNDGRMKEKLKAAWGDIQ